MQNIQKSGVFILLSLLLPFFVFSQASSPSLFHSTYNDLGANAKAHRPWKTRLNTGLVFGFCKGDPHYTTNASGSAGYTFGLMEEIPLQTKSTIMIGAEILNDGVSFNSYFFSPGNSFLYNGNEPYYHDITMDELHFPIEYKFYLTPIDRKMRSIYMTLGWVFRYISYVNATVTNTGLLVWEGQNDITTLTNRLFSPFGGSIVEVTLGYQRFSPKRRKRGWFFALEYDYGVSWLHYSGNEQGSNDIIFKLNTLTFKLGLTR